MNTKQKGSNGERELIHKFWSVNYAAIRSAGSGSCKYPVPDIIAANGLRRLAIECKVTKDHSKLFYQKEIEDLESFCKLFGAEGYVAVKFPRQEWFFFTLEDLKQTKSDNFSISEKDAPTKALSFEQLTNNF